MTGIQAKEIVLCSTPRSGSTVLAEAMFLTGRLGAPDEFFNNDESNKGDLPHTIFAQNYIALGAKSYADYVEKVSTHYRSPNGVHSVKMHFPHFYDALRAGYFRLGAPRYYVFIHREDLVAQTISCAVAMKTQKWNSTMKSSIADEPDIPDELLAQVYRDIAFDNLRWKAFFEMFNVNYISLEYNDIVADVASAVAAIADHAEVELDSIALKSIVGQLTLTKQSSGNNARLKAKLTTLRLDNFGPGNILFDTNVLFPTAER